MSKLLTGSICLTDIPKSQIKKVLCKDGIERMYLNIAVIERNQPQTFGNRTLTHFISCAPRKEERVEGVKYIIGDLESRGGQPIQAPTSLEIDQAPSMGSDEELPF